jgi:hypothetical protein
MIGAEFGVLKRRLRSRLFLCGGTSSAKDSPNPLSAPGAGGEQKKAPAGHRGVSKQLRRVSPEKTGSQQLVLRPPSANGNGRTYTLRRLKRDRPDFS